MACVSCSFNSFSIFLLSLKQQQNLMKIVFSCIHFPIWPHPPIIMKKLYFIVVNHIGWQVWYFESVWQQNQMTLFHWVLDNGSISSPVVAGARDVGDVLPEVEDLSQWPLHHLTHHPLLHVHKHCLHARQLSFTIVSLASWFNSQHSSVSILWFTQSEMEK